MDYAASPLWITRLRHCGLRFAVDYDAAHLWITGLTALWISGLEEEVGAGFAPTLAVLRAAPHPTCSPAA